MMVRRSRARIVFATAAALMVAGCATDGTGGGISIPPATPRTAQPFADPPGQFRFVIVGDRTGGHRPGVFEKAMDQLL